MCVMHRHTQLQRVRTGFGSVSLRAKEEEEKEVDDSALVSGGAEAGVAG